MWIPSATRFPWPTPFIPLALAPWPHIAAFQFHHARPVDPAVNTQPIQHTPSFFLLPNCQRVAIVTIISLSLSHFSQQNHYNLQRSANFLVFPFATFPSSRPSCFQNLTSPGFPFCFFSSFFASLPFFPSKSPPSPSQKPAMVTSGLTELSHCITSCILSYSPPHPAQPHTSTPQSIPV